MGMCSHIDWAAWDQRLNSLAQWLEVRCLDAQFVGEHYGIAGGVATHMMEIDWAILVD